MDKAYDAAFKKVVDATVVAKTSYHNYGNRFRYQCLCCGEEVYLAAAESHEIVPHFRHRRGNNDTNCEIYLGQPGAIEHCVSIRKHNKERVSFYFNKDRMTYEICVFFTEEELEDFEINKCKMLLSSKYNSQPFLNLPLRKDTIIPYQKNFFTINEYSNDYYVGFGNETKKYCYSDVINKNRQITVFKAGSQKDRYKRVLSNTIYTDNSYIAISESKENIHNLLSLENSVLGEEEFSFITANKQFYGTHFSIQYVDYNILTFFQQHGYQIETSEHFNILWPPMFLKDSCYISTVDEVYVDSSFELVPHGNINLEESCIEKTAQNIRKITFDDDVFIYEKNIDVCIKKDSYKLNDIKPLEPEIKYLNKFNVPENHDYFLYNKYGCTHLVSGFDIYLCENDKIVGYKNGHKKEIIYSYKIKQPTSEELLKEILMYNPRTEMFDPDDFMYVDVDETILAYLEECYKSRKINSVIKRYIKEGLL